MSPTVCGGGEADAAGLESLAREIAHHQHLYWVEGQPEIEDAEYDRKVEAYREALAREGRPDQAPPEPELPGAEGRPVFTHLTPMTSLRKAYSMEDLLAWIRRTCGQPGPCWPGAVVEPKYD